MLAIALLGGLILNLMPCVLPVLSLKFISVVSQGGRAPITLPSGEVRRFLGDGDTITLRARARRGGAAPIGFGECRGVVLPAMMVE